MLDLKTLYNNTFYLKNNPDVAAGVANGTIANGFTHFKTSGRFERRDPGPFFHSEYYLQTNTDVVLALDSGKLTVADHFVRHGQYERRNPHPMFDTDYYLSTNPDVALTVREGNMTPLEHFIKVGQFEHRNPSVFFDTKFYLTRYPEVANAVSSGLIESPFSHYLQYGIFEGRLTTLPNPSDDLTQAINLDPLTESQTVNGTVSTTEPSDLYKFGMTRPQSVNIKLDGLRADADLELIQDLNSNGEIGHDDIMIASTVFGVSPEVIGFQSSFPGTYYLRVTPVDSQTPYQLTINLGTNHNS